MGVWIPTQEGAYLWGMLWHLCACGGHTQHYFSRAACGDCGLLLPLMLCNARCRFFCGTFLPKPLMWCIHYTHTHPFNGLLSGTTQVSRYQKGKTNLDFTGARDSEWQWHQLGLVQVCTSLQTDNHASTPPLSFYRPDALPAAQPTASKHWRQVMHTFVLWKKECLE